MPNFYNQLTSKSSLYNLLEALKDNINFNINCVKVATVESFNPADLTVVCRVNNKIMTGLKSDGNQELMDYPLIYAKVHFFGWGDVGATYPITKGMEGFLLFNDREIETWFMTGGTGNLKYERTHDLSDALFICGLHSQPNMIEFVEECLHLFYKTSHIQLKEKDIDVTTDNDVNITTQNDVAITTGNDVNVAATKNIKLEATNINSTGVISQTGNCTITGLLTADGVVDTTAFTGHFTTGDSKTVVVENGIIKSVS